MLRALVVAMFASVAKTSASSDCHPGCRCRTNRTAMITVPPGFPWTWGVRGWGQTDELASLDAAETMVRMHERERA